MTDQLVIAAAPLIAVGGLLAAMALLDLLNRDRADLAGNTKVLWAIAILLIPIGPIAYLWFGRKVKPKIDDR